MEKEKENLVFPNFLGIGAQKAGTTTLYNILKSHPDIYLPEKKELNFFQVNTTYQKGIRQYAQKHFIPSVVSNAKWIGEITPSYLTSPKVPERIWKSLGSDVKFLCVLREPVQRAYSHYQMMYKTGKIKYSFEKVLKEEEKGRSDTFLIRNSLYGIHLKRYFELFPKENFLVISFEELKSDQKAVRKKIEEFFNICPFPEIVQKKDYQNKGGIPRFGMGELLFKRPEWVERLWKIIKKNSRLESKIKNLLLKEAEPLPPEKIERLEKNYFRKDLLLLESLLGYRPFDSISRKNKIN